VPALLDEAAEPVAVPPGLQSRVLGAVAREPRPGTVPLRAPAGRRARPRWPATWALGAAAAVALAFLAGLGVGHGLPTGGGQPAPAARTIRLAAADGGGASGVATVRTASAGRVIELTVRGLAPPPPGH